MIRNVVIFWLWWQWKQFIKYFLKNKYNVIWICRSLDTKKNIENEFSIKVYNDYRNILDNKIDLLILCAFPIDIYEEILKYSENYTYKILSDLPISFNLEYLEKYVKNEKVFLFLIETKLEFYENYFIKYNNEIIKINCLLLQNKDNLKQQKYLKESVIVDTQYMCNNLIGTNLDLLNINYKFVERGIKNIEYIIELFLKKWEKVIYKYEDWKGIIIFCDIYWAIVDKKIENILFDTVLSKYIDDINLNKNSYKEEYINFFTYLLTNFNYENKDF